MAQEMRESVSLDEYLDAIACGRDPQVSSSAPSEASENRGSGTVPPTGVVDQDSSSALLATEQYNAEVILKYFTQARMMRAFKEEVRSVTTKRIHSVMKSRFGIDMSVRGAATLTLPGGIAVCVENNLVDVYVKVPLSEIVLAGDDLHERVNRVNRNDRYVQCVITEDQCIQFEVVQLFHGGATDSQLAGFVTCALYYVLHSRNRFVAALN